jgi:hypothetical protein
LIIYSQYIDLDFETYPDDFCFSAAAAATLLGRRGTDGFFGQVLEDEESLLQRLLDFDDRDDVHYLCNRLMVCPQLSCIPLAEL